MRPLTRRRVAKDTLTSPGIQVIEPSVDEEQHYQSVTKSVSSRCSSSIRLRHIVVTLISSLDQQSIIRRRTVALTIALLMILSLLGRRPSPFLSTRGQSHTYYVTERTRRRTVPTYSLFLEELQSRYQSSQTAKSLDASLQLERYVRNSQERETDRTGIAVESVSIEKQPTTTMRQCNNRIHIPDPQGHARDNRRLIPPIIHQWIPQGRPLDTREYPELTRLQNSWRIHAHKGPWRYRMYTPETARSFVQTNYPSTDILSVYDSLSSSQQKEFFTYLVLYQHGGVYADVNVMLETNLDTLFLPQMDFVTVRNHHDQDSALHCLWNGFLASKPGHPFLKRIIQDVVDAQGPCTSDSLRTQSVDTGFCGLGRAVKTVLGQNPWKEFVPGLYEWDADPINFGQTLILLMSRDDMGATRCSDIDRNRLVVSTNLMGVTGQSILERVSSRRTTSAW